MTKARILPPILLLSFALSGDAARAQEAADKFTAFSCGSSLCHGAGGDRPLGDGPSLTSRVRAESYTLDRFKTTVRTGRTGGMPSFRRPDDDVDVEAEGLISDPTLALIYRWLGGHEASTGENPEPQPSPEPSQSTELNDEERCIEANIDATWLQQDIPQILAACRSYYAQCAHCHGANLFGGQVAHRVAPSTQSNRQPPLGGTNIPSGQIQLPLLIVPNVHRKNIPLHERQPPSSQQRQHPPSFWRVAPTGTTRIIIEKFMPNFVVPGAKLYEHYCTSCHEHQRDPRAQRLLGVAKFDRQRFDQVMTTTSHPCLARHGEGSQPPADRNCKSWLTKLNRTDHDNLFHYICEVGSTTCASRALISERILQSFIDRQIADAQRRAEEAAAELAANERRTNLPNHSYYVALDSGNCTAAGHIADGLTQIGNSIRRSCSFGRLRTGRITRTTLSEAIDPRQRPLDRDGILGEFGTGVIEEPGSDGGTPGRGVIEEPGAESGILSISADSTRCVVPELFVRGPRIDWGCGTGIFRKSGIITCPDNTSLIRVTRSIDQFRFQCLTGPWEQFLDDLRARNSTRP